MVYEIHSRSFIAIDIPESIKEKFKSISIDQSLRKVSIENIHITLLFLGNVPEARIKDVIAVLDSLNTESFDISIKGLGTFDGSMPRVLFAKIAANEKLEEIYGILYSKLESICTLEKRGFIPHVTIARSKGHEGSRQIKDLVEKYGNTEFGIFKCNSVKLKKSLLSASGPVYSDLFVKTFY
ncbi:MAG: RNA 2',3'-cyclic phosphodiesterase [Candidatus Micrarchaeia archaeon]